MSAIPSSTTSTQKCPRPGCSGLLVSDTAQGREETLIIAILRCLNCGNYIYPGLVQARAPKRQSGTKVHRGDRMRASGGVRQPQGSSRSSPPRIRSAIGHDAEQLRTGAGSTDDKNHRPSAPVCVDREREIAYHLLVSDVLPPSEVSNPINCPGWNEDFKELAIYSNHNELKSDDWLDLVFRLRTMTARWQALHLAFETCPKKGRDNQEGVHIWDACNVVALRRGRDALMAWLQRGGLLKNREDPLVLAEKSRRRQMNARRKRELLKHRRACPSGRLEATSRYFEPISPQELRTIFETEAGVALVGPLDVFKEVLIRTVNHLKSREVTHNHALQLTAALAYVYVPGWQAAQPTKRRLGSPSESLLETLTERLRALWKAHHRSVIR